jgi:hypothetical protein
MPEGYEQEIKYILRPLLPEEDSLVRQIGKNVPLRYIAATAGLTPALVRTRLRIIEAKLHLPIHAIVAARLLAGGTGTNAKPDVDDDDDE